MYYVAFSLSKINCLLLFLGVELRYIILLDVMATQGVGELGIN